MVHHRLQFQGAQRHENKTLLSVLTVMTWYVILFFAAALTGMAISVAVFGTGGKRKRVFRDIYFSVEDNDGIGVIYAKTGEYSAVLEMKNPVQKYSADSERYYDFCHLFTAVAQTLGEDRKSTRLNSSHANISY